MGEAKRKAAAGLGAAKKHKAWRDNALGRQARSQSLPMKSSASNGKARRRDD
jgi:hypothetical protein